MMGTHAGAISKTKLRTEADLSPTEGKLILLEYCEERPIISMSKGMSCKIVNYYRGDKARCPVSAGGGDRPSRRKRGEQTLKDTTQNGRERLPRLEGPNRLTSVVDWVGKLPKRTQKERSEKEAIDILPEGVTEILHPKVHGPFLGEVEEGTTVTGMISNLFVAPMFRHEPESTDFLMILTPPTGATRPGQHDSMGVVLRDLPESCFTIGQTEPRTRVYAPNSQGEKNFVGPWVSYQIAKTLTRSQTRDGHGLRFDELQERVLPNQELPANALRQRLKQVAIYDKNTGIWTTKPVGYEDYPGLEALGKSIAAEGIACFESASAASRRLADLGINQLVAGSHTVTSVGMTIVYLVGQLNAVRELARKTKKLVELSRVNKSIQPIQVAYYEMAAAELDIAFKMFRQKHEIAQFIFEELQLTPWHLTGEFIDVHKKGEGTGMMKLTGLGDPSGQGEGFSFLREADSKPIKSIGANDALNEQVKKITGTADDLRKLTMKQMAALLRSYGMGQKQIDTLKRWDRVHVIRDLSTKAASDGIGDGLERFARGEKMKLSEQKQMYRDRVQVIWRRQLAALSMDTSDKAMGPHGSEGNGANDLSEEETAAIPGEQTKKSQKNDKDAESSDSDSDDDDDLAATLEEEMIHRVSHLFVLILIYSVCY
jgi:transcription initiation factor TFIID subunit 1